MTQTDRGVAISLFAGAGGLDLGAEAAGYWVAAAVERDRDAALTMEKNFSHLHSAVIRADILDVPTRDLLRAAGLKPRQRPDLLIGGPPCTPFSKSGFWLEWKRSGLDPDASLLQAYTRVLAEARPRAFVLENVYALTYNNQASRPAYERLLREIDAAGYDYRAKVLNAADHGVPQARPRLFVIGVPKGERLPEHPEATHGGNWERRQSDATLAMPRGPTSPPPRRSMDSSAIQSPESPSAVSTPTSFGTSRPVTTTCITPLNVDAPNRFSSGASAIGHSCSSCTLTGRVRRSKLSLARTWARSTGTTAG